MKTDEFTDEENHIIHVTRKPKYTFKEFELHLSKIKEHLEILNNKSNNKDK